MALEACWMDDLAKAQEAVDFMGVTPYKHTNNPKPLNVAYETLKAKYPQK